MNTKNIQLRGEKRRDKGELRTKESEGELEKEREGLSIRVCVLRLSGRRKREKGNKESGYTRMKEV